MRPLLVIASVFVFASCGHNESRLAKEPILLADREAPLGWVSLKVYEDSTFEFISRGLRTETVFPGHVTIHDDTLDFHYTDSIPAAGTRAVVGDKVVLYIAGKYREAPEIKLNKLSH